MKKLSKRNRKRTWPLVRRLLRISVFAVLARCLFVRNFESAFICVLTLALFCVPDLIERTIRVDIPPVMEGIIYCFIYAAEILGEVNSFYTKIPMWDTILHTLNGFLVAAVGFALVDMFNRSERFTFRLSPAFLAIVAFCFSMTVGVLWEFFEFGMDLYFGTDMQKDWIVTTINSVKFDPDNLNRVVHMPIESLIVNGEDWIAKYGGYIDIGLIDTMKDLQVNFVGAVIFSIVGYFYVKNRGKGRLAAGLIPRVLKKGELLPQEEAELRLAEEEEAERRQQAEQNAAREAAKKIGARRK